MYTNPVFVIGLGGIGNAVARLVRQRFLQTLGDIPETILIRSIDTADQLPMDDAEKLPADSYVRLEGFAANEVINNLALYREIAHWWNYDRDVYSPGFIDNGAGARRPVGRLFFFKQFERIYHALYGAFSKPLDLAVQERLVQSGLGQVKRQPTVYIIASIAGGTGAGMFLDAAFLARELLRRVGYDGAGIKIAGILALPSVIDIATRESTSLEARNRRINAYGGLCELDALQRGWSGGEVSLLYPSPIGDFQPVAPLFDYTYFFSRTTATGYLYSDQENLLVRVAHFLYQMTVSDAGERLGQVTINVPEYFSPEQRQVAGGLVATYGAFGVEWLEIPRAHLVRRWCEQIGSRVAALVGDLNWDTEQRRNLDQQLAGRAPQELSNLPRALDLATRSAVELEAVAEFRVIKDVLDSISVAQKPDELRAALQRADTEIPRLVANVRGSLGRLDEAAWLNWLFEVAAELIADREFRIGGARRFLERLASRIQAAKSPVPQGERLTIDAVVTTCTSGMFTKKVTNPSPALEWARQRIRQAASATLAEFLGPHADRIGQTAQELAAFLVEMSQAVTRGAAQLRALPPGPEIPKENWLVDPMDLDRAIEANMEDVASSTAHDVAQVLAREFLGLRELRARDAARFEGLFVTTSIDAIERGAMRHTTRPADSAERLQRRVVACEPMMHIHSSGTELMKVMRPEVVAKPVRLVLTKLEGEPRVMLTRWTEEQARAEGKSWTYQIASSADSLRDDVLHMTFGWPLWLFREVRDCASTTSEAQRGGQSLPRFCRVLREVSSAQSHDIKPVDESQSEVLFATAFVLGHIGIAQSFDTIAVTFSREAFGTAQDVPASIDDVWDTGIQAFKVRNLDRLYKKDIDKRLATPDEKRELRNALLVSCERLRSDAKPDNVPDRTWARRGQLIDKANEFAKSIVIL